MHQGFHDGGVGEAAAEAESIVRYVYGADAVRPLYEEYKNI